ncbi:MAG: DNA mismatch repair protein MutS, partial [Dehalococcoidales bacterium]|nr:DNA mismatch repair protein MutS [Dehalococcoidales bacterium]
MKEGSVPIRQQYLNIKLRYPQAIVCFRIGDFYETFDEDARIVSKELDIVLTSKEMGKGHRVPLAGFPYHSLDNHLARLVNAGHKVAICEQTSPPGETRGLVEREVVRVVTPGTVVEPGLLNSKTNNYLASLVLDDDEVGIAYVDITTSEFATTQLPLSRALQELERLTPSEIITPESSEMPDWQTNTPVTRLDDYWFEPEVARQTLLDHFGAATLDGYGCSQLPLAVMTAGAIIHYIQETQKGALGQITGLTTYSTDSFMALDVETQSNLELFRSGRFGTTAGSLLSIIDLTKTSMGSRLLKKWLSQPQLDLTELLKRLDVVEWFYANTLPRNQTLSLLSKTADLERLINRVRSNIVSPRELVALRHGLEIIPDLTQIVEGGTSNSPINWLKEELKPRQDVVDLIGEALADEPSVSLSDGNVIKKGFSEELDSLRLVSQNARQYLANL